MNPSIHKFLMHGCQISSKFPLPIEFFSENSIESWYKLNRANITQKSRLLSKKARLLDVFNRAVYLSDPKMSLVYINKRLKFRNVKDLPQEIEQFFMRLVL